ncbi:Ubiquitin-like protein 3 [Apophysomyces ossiformis]|uniref:Ubiquitin-like protein 3 n=1 Tax=Apophysomyces ossiformis TaxID=679940 RepID=A0A8H7BYI6_9FUNG|nr:Ubiquitin-like protein 3 [Apophysomyces ossiformis]
MASQGNHHMAEVEQTTTTSPLQSSLPPSVPPTLSSYAYDVDRSTAPTTEHGDNISATAIRSPSNPASVSHSPLPSLQTYQESSLEDDEDKVPADKVHLTMLLVSGNRYTFEFDPSATIAQVKQLVHDQWPQEWSDRSQPSVNSLEVVYLGKFLENESTLESNRLRGGHTTTVHLIIRQFSNKAEDTKSVDAVPRCKCCIIL